MDTDPKSIKVKLVNSAKDEGVLKPSLEGKRIILTIPVSPKADKRSLHDIAIAIRDYARRYGHRSPMGIPVTVTDFLDVLGEENAYIFHTLLLGIEDIGDVSFSYSDLLLRPDISNGVGDYSDEYNSRQDD